MSQCGGFQAADHTAIPARAFRRAQGDGGLVAERPGFGQLLLRGNDQSQAEGNAHGLAGVEEFTGLDGGPKTFAEDPSSIRAGLRSNQQEFLAANPADTIHGTQRTH